MKYTLPYTSPLGEMLLAADDDTLLGVYFLGQKHFPTTLPDSNASRPGSVLDQTARQLADYFQGRRNAFDLPLAPQGTAFQRDVWDALLSIPYGETVAYGELARRIGRPQSVRAVGAAVGRNPITIIIPCHRVVGTNGSLTGYAGGLERKQALLDLEKGGWPTAGPS
jgi:methylated-DNA-[protein]-cysteine S-methyltransferase